MSHDDWQISDYIAEATEDLQEEVGALKGMLRELEWVRKTVQNVNRVRVCSVCGGLHPDSHEDCNKFLDKYPGTHNVEALLKLTTGHAPDCRLAKLL